jgi:outer membrane protein OmpA-like peptidoglycan-associated protein
MREDVPRTYIVFFNYNAVELSPDARTVVHQAALSAKKLKGGRIELAGYTGREEDARTAAPLADKRFGAVEAALAAEGIDPATLSRVSVIDEVPLPATAVRRIEIRLRE